MEEKELIEAGKRWINHLDKQKKYREKYSQIYIDKEIKKRFVEYCADKNIPVREKISKVVKIYLDKKESKGGEIENEKIR